jgi:hypothetical protein
MRSPRSDDDRSLIVLRTDGATEVRDIVSPTRARRALVDR